MVEAVELVVGGDRRFDARVGELLEPGSRGSEVLELADRLPVVEARVPDEELVGALGPLASWGPRAAWRRDPWVEPRSTPRLAVRPGRRPRRGAARRCCG